MPSFTMAVSCVTDDMITAAVEAGFCCIADSPYEQVKLYLLREAAGLSSTTPQELVTLAKCHICEYGNIAQGVEVYLLCQLQGGVVPVTCEMLEGDGDPTGVTTPDFSGQLYNDTTADTYYYSTGTTSADWTAISGGACLNVEGAGDPT